MSLISIYRNPHPYGLVVTGTSIFFTDMNTKNVHHIEKSDITKVKHIQLDVGLLFSLDDMQSSDHGIINTFIIVY